VSALRDAVLARRSYSSVTDQAPTHDEVLSLVEAAGRVADHSSLRPWRLIELRGAARGRLGAALVAAGGATGKDAVKLAAKPLRAPLLIAIVASRVPSHKVPTWEQDAVASGVAHTLSLLLDDAGWGVMWRTGEYTRADAVSAELGIGAHERLMGWLYVGGVHESKRGGSRKPIDAERFVTTLD